MANSPNIKFDIKITGNPMIDGVILKAAGMLAGGLAVHAMVWLNAHGFAFDEDVLKELFGGGIIAIAVVIAGWIKNKNDLAKAAQGGINLVMNQMAVTTDGKTITSIGEPGAAPPLAVTPKAGTEIYKLADPAVVEAKKAETT